MQVFNFDALKLFLLEAKFIQVVVVNCGACGCPETGKWGATRPKPCIKKQTGIFTDILLPIAGSRNKLTYCTLLKAAQMSSVRLFSNSSEERVLTSSLLQE